MASKFFFFFFLFLLIDLSCVFVALRLQGGSGYAKGIVFEHINLTEVQNPILIDQYYCPDLVCSNKVKPASSSVCMNRLVVLDFLLLFFEKKKRKKLGVG